MFNDYVWNTYLNAGGKDVAKMFESNLSSELTEKYADEVCKLHSCYCPSESIEKEFRCNFDELYSDIKNGIYLFEDGEYSIESAMQLLSTMVIGDSNATPQQIFSCFTSYLEYFSTSLAIELTELFVPYYFKYNFNILEKIALEFGIDLPSTPKKKDYQGRFFYYGKICATLYDFRVEHNMTPYELCAFLYDFAPKYVGGVDSYIIKDLPEPKSAFFIGGSQKDAFLDGRTDIIALWQCSPDTRAGDMIVMYLRTPVSAVDSVWRSVSIGFNDPFFYYYRCTYIANPVGVKRITQKQLEHDSVFMDLPIVRKNMQGINGVELLPSQYNHLMDISQADVPRLEFVVYDSNQTYTCEKDVEDKLIKPLIAKFGYSNDEWIPQMYIEIGNHTNALIPDFVLLPSKTSGHHAAFAIIEAKLSIPNSSYLDKVKTQARSYAKQLGVKYSVVASKEKVWVSLPDDDFSKDIFIASWDELSNADTFSSLFKLLGKR